MKILILGGSIFLGRHLVDAAEASDIEVTLFNRGVSGPGLFPHLRHLRGDRRSDLKVLTAAAANQRWDAVIDTSGYHPSTVRAAVAAVAHATDLYVFVSTISVYVAGAAATHDERSPVQELAEGELAELTGGTYGGLKALCEKAADEIMPGRVLAVRPGLIVGPYDPTGRFTYWVERVARGGAVLAPGRPDDPVQFIDARDLADFILRAVRQRATGLVNATGPATSLGIGALLEEIRTVTSSDAHFVWAPPEFLRQRGVAPYTELPLWLPAHLHDMSRIDISHAQALGLTFRPVRETIRDTLAWTHQRTIPHPPTIGLEPLREAALLDVLCAGEPEITALPGS